MRDWSIPLLFKEGRLRLNKKVPFLSGADGVVSKRSRSILINIRAAHLIFLGIDYHPVCAATPPRALMLMHHLHVCRHIACWPEVQEDGKPGGMVSIDWLEHFGYAIRRDLGAQSNV